MPRATLRLTDAQRDLAGRNIGLAHMAAKRVCGGFDEDAQQEAVVGLCRAARSYDPCRGIKFSTYSYYAARNEAIRYRRLNRADSRHAEFNDRLHAADSPPSSGDDEELDRLARAVAALPDRERIILCMRFGIGYAAPCTLLKIGRRVGLCQERVRQIVEMSLASLYRQLESQ